MTADYSLAPESPEVVQEMADASEPQENNIEFENSIGHVRPTAYFTKVQFTVPRYRNNSHCRLMLRENKFRIV